MLALTSLIPVAVLALTSMCFDADKGGCKMHRCEVLTSAYVIRYTVVGLMPVAGRCDGSTFAQMHTTLSM